MINDSFCQNKKRSDSAITITLSTDNDLSEKDLDPTSFDKDDEEMQNKSLDEEEKELCSPEIIRGAEGNFQTVDAKSKTVARFVSVVTMLAIPSHGV